MSDNPLTIVGHSSHGSTEEFLDDCGHDLAGQTVPLMPLPDWLVR